MAHAPVNAISMFKWAWNTSFKHSGRYNRLLSEYLCGVCSLWFTCLSANINKQLLAASARYVIEMRMLFRKHSLLNVPTPQYAHALWSMASQSIQITYSEAPTSVINTLRPRQNGRHFADDTSNSIFVNENVSISIEFHWSLFLRVQLTIFQHWFR